MMKVAVLTVLATSMVSTVTDTEDGFPPIVKKKKLYAKTDLRGQMGPELAVEEWVTRRPDTKGKVIILEFFSTWNSPSRDRVKVLNGWATKFKRDAVVIGLADETPESVKAFLSDSGSRYSVAIDTTSRTKEKLGIIGIPHTIVMSPDGVVRWQGWPDDPNDKLTDEILDQIVKASRSRDAT